MIFRIVSYKACVDGEGVGHSSGSKDIALRNRSV